MDSAEENITSSLSAEKLDNDALAIQKEHQGEPAKDMKSQGISSGGLKLENNHGDDELADKMEMSEHMNCKDQGDKSDDDQSHRDIGGESNALVNKMGMSGDSNCKDEGDKLDSDQSQRDMVAKSSELVDKMDMNEDFNCKHQGDKLESDQSRRDMGGKSNGGRDSVYYTQERESDSEKGQKNLHDKVESNAKVFGEEKEPELVFDGAQVLGREDYRVVAIPSLDHDSETPGVVEKAVALTNFVKLKSVVAVSTFLRHLSGNSDECGPDVADDADINFPDKDSEVGDASQKIMERPAQAMTMKGRIILYTKLGCQDCKDARLFLYWKNLRYTEINIDVFPGRKKELEKFSGSSTVPKVLFNEVLIGGLRELKDLDESGKLDEKIDYLVSEAPSFEAPLPPLSGEDDVSNKGAIDELAIIIRKMKEFVVVKDRFYKMRRFTKSFSGSEAVDFLSEDQYLEREEAIEFGRKLASKLFFQHVLEENLFEDGNHLYRFLHDDPVVSQCHNIPKGIIDLKPKPIVQIEARLRFIMCAILEAYVSEDGKHIDYRSIHGSEEFARYLRTVEELHRVELQDMRREQRLAFFINLYNMMAIHAILVWGHPDGPIERRKLFGDFKYVIGGSAYSLSAIQNGILRGNQRPPYNLQKPFSPKDKRAMMALPYPEPLIHFALVFGTRSGPVLRCYSPGDVDKELMDAARSFLRSGGLIIDFDNKVASANKILKWFSADFGSNEMEVLKHSSNYLEPAVAEALLELLATTQLKVIYQPYDWALNC